MPSSDQNKKVLKELYYGFLVIVPACHLREMQELVTRSEEPSLQRNHPTVIYVFLDKLGWW